MSSEAAVPRRRAARLAPAERRAAIRRAARATALADGLGAVTLRAVAAKAGVAPALVAHYAPSMEELVAETFAAIVREELDEMAALVDDREPRAALVELIQTLLAGTRDDVTAVWVEAWALGRRSEPLAAAVRDEMDAWARLLAGIVEAGVRAGVFRVDDPAAAAWQLLGMIDGLNAQALVRWGEASERSALMLRAAEGMLGGAR
ncbi:TetR family transcriptional regulator C-terminal domain-containing protein [Microbacterium oryzae]|uniref:TetR/AcrR family transcriptional regulator n=1 Tax=Microbacterium oryzae TaxID=743009 RepID=UPI0025B094D1|nr:TetR family transcriptional regulator C-terminal domain-containing protein [Microbacterium oryzae]MDN3311124.1 TetR family transcriptional regulator C-terminal domain-containing protein [Microbacterium oryzae]